MKSSAQSGVSADAVLSQAIDRLWVRFLPEIRERVALLESSAIAVSAKKLTSSRPGPPRRKLAGVLGTFNLARGTTLARELEAFSRESAPRPQRRQAPCRHRRGAARYDRESPIHRLMPEQLHSSQVIPHDPFASPLDQTPQLDLRFKEPRPARRIWRVRELVAQVRDLHGVRRRFGWRERLSAARTSSWRWRTRCIGVTCIVLRPRRFVKRGVRIKSYCPMTI